MNHNCHGDFFTLDEKRWYRCLAGSAVVKAPENGDSCPSCDRPVIGGENPVVRTETVRLVTLADGVTLQFPVQAN